MGKIYQVVLVKNRQYIEKNEFRVTFEREWEDVGRERQKR